MGLPAQKLTVGRRAWELGTTEEGRTFKGNNNPEIEKYLLVSSSAEV